MNGRFGSPRPSFVFGVLVFVFYSCAWFLQTGVGFAQTLVVGNSNLENVWVAGSTETPRLYVDTTKPASGSGLVNRVRIGWWAWGGCSVGAEVEFFRRRGDDFTLVDRRGPFSPTTDVVQEYPLDPPLSIEEGDLIGISVPANDCATVRLSQLVGASLLSLEGNPSHFNASDAQETDWRALEVIATGDATLETKAIIPVVADSPGRDGSNWQTNVRILSRQEEPLDLTYRLRSNGRPGSVEDESATRTIAPGKLDVWIFPPAAGFPYPVAGSLDVRAAPEVDLEANTEWFVEMMENTTCGATAPLPLIPVNRRGHLGDPVLQEGQGGYLIAHLRREQTGVSGSYRTNVGIRALERGARITFDVEDLEGGWTHWWPAVWIPPNTFYQIALEDLSDDVRPETLLVKPNVISGDAIFYESVVDRMNNSFAIQLATVAWAFPGYATPRRCE